MSTAGFVLVQYRSNSLSPTLLGGKVHDDPLIAEADAAEHRKDAIASRKQVRIAVARLDVIE